jgi:hypothetical protein
MAENREPRSGRTEAAERLPLDAPYMRTFLALLVNTLLVSVINFTVWFAITFGFAQSVEQAASPRTAFLISPIAQFVFIPFMTTGTGARTIGPWFGTGPDRGIALVLVVAGILGLLMTIYAIRSRFYRELSERYLAVGATVDEPAS